MSDSSLFAAIVPAPFGGIGVRIDADAIVELVYLPPTHAPKAPDCALAEQTAVQLDRYFADPDSRFDLPLAPAGTPFQRRIWDIISAIPRGSVLTYGDVARRAGSAPRAVGQACGANWFPIVIPCHRVTATGGLGGFARHRHDSGFHPDVKRWLLAHEGVAGYCQLV